MARDCASNQRERKSWGDDSASPARQSERKVSEAASSKATVHMSSGESLSHNKYSAHLPHSRPGSPDSNEWGPGHRPSKSLTLSSCSVFGSASSDIHKNPNVIRQRQHRSRSSNVFPSKACALSGRRSLATYPFAASSNTSSFLLFSDRFTTLSTSRITHLQAWTPFWPNLAALVDSTHRWRKLSGTQISFEVATEMLNLSGSSPATQNAIVLGAPL